jgi:hypothetical protein
MHSDTIVNEIHQFRAQLLEQHKGNFAAYFTALQKKQQENPANYTNFVHTGSEQLPSSETGRASTPWQK